MRDAACKKVMTDLRMQPGTMTMPFNRKCLIYRGFDVLVEV